MSYDVWLEVDGKTVTDWHNYTYNISFMLKTAWDGASMDDMNGKTAAEALPMLEYAIDRMSVDALTYDVLALASGWGDRAGCVEWLKLIRDDCREFPDAKVVVG